VRPDFQAESRATSFSKYLLCASIKDEEMLIIQNSAQGLAR